MDGRRLPKLSIGVPEGVPDLIGGSLSELGVSIELPLGFASKAISSPPSVAGRLCVLGSRIFSALLGKFLLGTSCVLERNLCFITSSDELRSFERPPGTTPLSNADAD